MARWPRAGQAELIPAAFKTRPVDFLVTESLDFEPTDAGEHLMLCLEKCNLSTPEVARMLATLFSVPQLDVAYAGMKDKRAITRQWFSVRGGRDEKIGIGKLDSAIRVLEIRRHQRKLQRGQIRDNRFEITLRGIASDAWVAGLERLKGEGAPNYFGPQRFGRDNLKLACAWLPHRRSRRLSRFKQGLYRSVLRSFLFNEVLAARVTAATWQANIPGEAMLHGIPTGPLWGRGRSAAKGEALAIEEQALARHETICLGLEYAGLTQSRRALVTKPKDMFWESARSGELRVTFSLPAGNYATSLLAEVFELASPLHAQV